MMFSIYKNIQSKYYFVMINDFLKLLIGYQFFFKSLIEFSHWPTLNNWAVTNLRLDEKWIQKRESSSALRDRIKRSNLIRTHQFYGVEGSVSPTFYEQLLRVQRSQKRKKQLNLTVFLVLLESAHVKAARKMLVKLTRDVAMEEEGSKTINDV